MIFDSLTLHTLQAQHTSVNQSVKNFLLNQNVAILSFGSQRFRLKVLEDLCTIEVNIEGRNPRAALKRLMEQVQVIITECMKSLICFTAVSYSTSKGKSKSGGELVFDADTFLIPISQIRSVVSSHSVLNRPGGRRLLSETQAKEEFHIWLGGQNDSNQFDLFLSYRWGPNDSAFVQCVYDRFSLYTVGGDNREIHVFLDKECLEVGRYYLYIVFTDLFILFILRNCCCCY